MTASDTSSAAPSLEAAAEREHTPDRLEARIGALQFPLRAHRSSPRWALWPHDLRETHETGLQLADPDGQNPTPTPVPERS
ncbi:hypothetical protein [Streptomyces sp. NPDC005828]|uniref:hypothetical protein n=1 Tax=Streptomyces sp. NPDC005828 TaxID=3157071 RepID=UPI0033D90E27